MTHWTIEVEDDEGSVLSRRVVQTRTRSFAIACGWLHARTLPQPIHTLRVRVSRPGGRSMFSKAPTVHFDHA